MSAFRRRLIISFGLSMALVVLALGLPQEVMPIMERAKVFAIDTVIWPGFDANTAGVEGDPPNLDTSSNTTTQGTTVMATFVVLNTADYGPGSLRQAI